jgi:ABC-type multidrug transport system ATPase subunit
MNGILQIRDLRFAYPQEAPVVSGWSASIGAGTTLLHGDTGSGKSTLLRVLAGSVAADEGRLTLYGVDLQDDPAAYRRNVFFCEPSTDAFDQVDAHACTAQLRGDDAHFDEALWQSLVEGFGLVPHLHKPMYMLSTGSKRKVWLAAALALQRPLTLLDEPAGALDGGSVRCLWQTLASLASRHDRAIVVASSDAALRVPLVATISLPLQAAEAHAR